MPTPLTSRPPPNQVVEGDEGYTSDGVEEEVEEEEEKSVASGRTVLSMQEFGGISAPPRRARRDVSEADMQRLAKSLRRAVTVPSSSPQQSSTRKVGDNAWKCVPPPVACPRH